MTCFASGRLQIIQANKEYQDAKKTIEVLQARMEATTGPDNQAVETAVAKAKAEAEVEIETLQKDIASKEKRIASLQASLVSLRKIVQKFEKSHKSGMVQGKNVDLAKSFPTSIYLQNLASIQPRTSLRKGPKNACSKGPRW